MRAVTLILQNKDLEKSQQIYTASASQANFSNISGHGMQSEEAIELNLKSNIYSCKGQHLPIPYSRGLSMCAPQGGTINPLGEAHVV